MRLRPAYINDVLFSPGLGLGFLLLPLAMWLASLAIILASSNASIGNGWTGALAVGYFSFLFGSSIYYFTKIIRLIRLVRRHRFLLCPKCLYDLGRSEGPCPECGKQSTVADRRRTWLVVVMIFRYFALFSSVRRIRQGRLS